MGVLRRRKAKKNAEMVSKRAPWKLAPFSLITAALAIGGLLLFSYPSVASWISQYNQSKIISDYSGQVEKMQPDSATQIQQAHAYNKALTSGAILGANTNVPKGDGQGADPTLDYSSLLNLNGGGLMARLKIPSINVDLPVYHGTSESTLLEGLGHLEGTSLPVGGQGTRSVITGHRGLANALMFTNLDKVSVGDTFTLEVFGEVLSYRVTDTQVVEPDKTESLRADPSKDLVTLVTCTPLGINSHRILVTGQRVIPTPVEDVAKAGEKPDIPGFPWWIVWITAGFMLVALYVWRAGYSEARAKKEESKEGSGEENSEESKEESKEENSADSSQFSGVPSPSGLADFTDSADDDTEPPPSEKQAELPPSEKQSE